MMAPKSLCAQLSQSSSSARKINFGYWNLGGPCSVTGESQVLGRGPGLCQGGQIFGTFLEEPHGFQEGGCPRDNRDPHPQKNLFLW